MRSRNRCLRKDAQGWQCDYEALAGATVCYDHLAEANPDIFMFIHLPYAAIPFVAEPATDSLVTLDSDQPSLFEEGEELLDEEWVSFRQRGNPPSRLSADLYAA